ncbi:hypothetical protein Dimus_012884 [Dionaea muscipula]
MNCSAWVSSLPDLKGRSNLCTIFLAAALVFGVYIIGDSLIENDYKEKRLKPSTSLLGIAVGIKQKETVKKIVDKFLSCAFVVMLFHYDGIVDEWKDIEWHDNVIHLSAKNQTKW